MLAPRQVVMSLYSRVSNGSSVYITFQAWVLLLDAVFAPYRMCTSAVFVATSALARVTQSYQLLVGLQSCSSLQVSREIQGGACCVGMFRVGPA
jgi:hypothetical protein